MNRVTLCGLLGKDPELRNTQNQTAVANFSVATSQKINGEEKTCWHYITVWGKLAENCAKYLRKGSKVLLEGEIDYQQWEKEGEKKYKTVINARTVEFLTPKKESNDTPQPDYNNPGLDDVPF